MASPQAKKQKTGRPEDEGFSWEGEMERPWETIEEDAEGNLITSKAKLARRKLMNPFSDKVIRRGVIRNIYCVIDLSASANLHDGSPDQTRFQQSLKNFKAFVSDFFDQNPLSQLGLLVAREGAAEHLSGFTSDKERLHTITDALMVSVGSGSASVENCLTMAIPRFHDAPPYATKEMLFLYNSLQTCDPGNILVAIKKATEQKIRCNIICRGAEVYVLKKLAEDTHGTFAVAQNEAHYSELLLGHVVPPALLAGTGPDDDDEAGELIEMGFPQKCREDSFCFCHSSEKLRTSSGYLCPRCKCKHCTLPTTCRTCSLTLVSAPHLARSYHHLFPLPAFTQLTPAAVSAITERQPTNTQTTTTADSQTSATESQTDNKTAKQDKAPKKVPSVVCTGCQYVVRTTTDVLFQCPSCKEVFCTDCDELIHNTLYNCPGCTM
eukprot:TRINITY_DN54909_c0_g1_i1.p1 TRINITY_DN54909_c0_g1~~TRINITY_DN54909_c0_g1_i1.p1  ORF type:complete len:437 (+),score=40.70 TRINITY_DN54909_c0_g1_i1:2-1312(+)